MIVWVQAELPEDRANPAHGIQQVRGGVALEGEDLVPGENIVAAAVLRQIRVPDGADPDGAGDVAPLGLGQLRGFLGDEREGAFLGLGEQGLEFDRIAGARLDGLAVLAEDRAEGNVLEAGQPDSF